MRTITLSLFICAALSTALATCAAPLTSASRGAPLQTGAPVKGKVKALIVTGGHGFQRAPFFAMFDSFPHIQWREVQHPEANNMYAPGQRDTYDVIVLYDMVQKISDEQKANFLETLKAGKGLLVLHHPLGSYQKWPEYAQIVGGKYLLSEQEIGGKQRPKSTFRHGVTFTVQIADRNHPITKGLADFEIHDEVYGGFWVSPDVHALLKVHHPESGEVVGWTSSYEKARVVCLQPGHDRSAYEDGNYRTLVHRSLLWVARRLTKSQ